MRHSRFPHYLRPGPDKKALSWLGSRLQKARDNKARDEVARRAGVMAKEIGSIEHGKFHLGLGRLRHIVQTGYNVDLLDLLAEYHNASTDPSAAKSSPFTRDGHYRICFGEVAEKKPTPLLCGGDGRNYVWATPLRRLKEQPMVTEFLELAPLRKRTTSGRTQANAHSGAEVIYVVHGSIEVHISMGAEASNSPNLKAGDCIHLRSDHVHYIENVDKNTSALLFITRTT